MARSRGRPSIIPTPEELRAVEHYVSIGYTQEQIASLLGRSVDWLQKRCRKELDHGTLRVNSMIAGKLFQKAMAGDTAALIFWCKTRMGWKETQVAELVGKDGRSLSDWWNINGLPPMQPIDQIALPEPSDAHEPDRT